MIGLITGGRQSGMTTKLIRYAHETDQYIVVANRERQRHTFNMARDMGMPIRNPITVQEAVAGRLDRTPYAMYHPGGGVLIDDMDAILQMLLHVKRIDLMGVKYGYMFGSEAKDLTRELEELRSACTALYAYARTMVEEKYGDPEKCSGFSGIVKNLRDAGLEV